MEALRKRKGKSRMLISPKWTPELKNLLLISKIFTQM